MKKIKPIIIIALLCISCSTFSQENPVYPSQAFSINLNADAFSGLEFGYHHRVHLLDHNPTLYASFNFPLFLAIRQKNLDTWETNFGITQTFSMYEKLIFVSSLNLFSGKHKQILGTFIPVGMDLKITPSLKTKSGYARFQLDYTQVLGTHITYDDLVKQSFQDILDVNGNPYLSEPTDGWYALTGNYMKYGIESLFYLTQKTALYFDLGMIQYFSKYTRGFDSMMYGQVPFYMDLQILFRI